MKQETKIHKSYKLTYEECNLDCEECINTFQMIGYDNRKTSCCPKAQQPHFTLKDFALKDL